MKSLIVVFSYHHKNTEKVAEAIAKVLNAEVRTPDQVEIEGLPEYDLIGFGSGIYDAKHHQSILELAEKLSEANNMKAFIFSTSAMLGEMKVADDHATLRTILESKGFTILDEFACKGFNTNSFLKYLGGMNKGRPNADDLKNAELFTENLVQLYEGQS